MKKLSTEEKVRQCLEKDCNVNLADVAEICKKDGAFFGAAVSGGADSVCLLICLCKILKKFDIPLKVISVNHFIRPDEETCGDIEFVKKTCIELETKGYDVRFFEKALKKGEVQKIADSRKMGIEEAARFLRYEAFEDFIKTEKIQYLCLAHNKNDFYETVLMRFLQGASCDSFSGISFVREKYIRPLMNVERNEIEAYLIENNQSWRTDKTNFDTAYLRNRIRNKLIPFLSENFDGWKSAVEKGALKAESDSNFINEYVEKIKIDVCKNSVCVDCNAFCNEHEGIQIRGLLKMCNLVSENCRVPFVFLQDVCSAVKNYGNFVKSKSLHSSGKTAENEWVNDGTSFSSAYSEKRCCEKRFADIIFYVQDNKLYVKKNETIISDYCFSDIIEETGFYEYDWGNLTVKSRNMNQNSCIFELEYKSGKTEKFFGDLPFQVTVNHL